MTTQIQARGRGRTLVWLGWFAGIVVAGMAAGVDAAAAWWGMYWPVILAGAMLHSHLREWRATSRLHERPVGVAD
jgi:hypothetical protein